jgi:hypothetical protein
MAGFVLGSWFLVLGSWFLVLVLVPVPVLALFLYLVNCPVKPTSEGARKAGLPARTKNHQTDTPGQRTRKPD